MIDLPAMVRNERDLIAMMLADEDCVLKLKRFPKPEWFINSDHRKICIAIEKLDTLDILKIQKLANIKPSVIADIMFDTPVSMNPDSYVDEIFRGFVARKIYDLPALWEKQDPMSDDFIPGVMANFESIQAINLGIQELISGGDAIDKWAVRLDAKMSGTIRPIPTNIPSLDKILGGGLHRGDVMTVGGRPGSGKSALLKTILVQMLRQSAPPKIAIFSCEMSSDEYMDRMVSEWTGIDGMKIIEALNLTDRDLDKIHEMVLHIHSIKDRFTFNAIQEQTKNDIKRLSKASKLKMSGLDLIIIDHLHLIKSHNHKLDERIRLTEITSDIKRLAQSSDCAILLASQLNCRAGEKPGLGSLKSSSSIEEDSNVVVLLHRPGLTDTHVDGTITELLIRKNRHGPNPVDLNLYFDESLTSFREIE